MPVQQNTYRKLDRDTAYNKVDNTSFNDCRNFRITSNDPLKSGALSSIKGNKPLSGDFSTLGYPNDKIIGNVQLRDYMILFTTNDDSAIPTASYGRIWSAPFYNDAVDMSDITLLYSGLLNFSQQHPIEDVVAYYESDTIQKVYWTDNYNNLRYCNIADPLLSVKEPDEFNVVQKFYSVTPEFSKMISGSIPVGMIQYAFRLYKLNGSVSNFSEASQLIPLTEYSLSAANTYKFKGSDRLDSNGSALSSGKGIMMTIDLSGVSNDNYDRIEVIAIHYAALNEAPNIYIVEVKPVSDIVTFTDEGIYNLGSYSLSEFVLINNPLKCKSIATKNNILFAANIEQSEYDVDYDARAYRWTASRQCRLDQANGEYWINQMTSSSSFIRYNSGGTSLGSVANMGLLPDDIDAICRNNVEYDKNQTSYLYQSDGATLGGEGINVSYTFSVSGSYKIDKDSTYIDDIGVEAAAIPYYYNGSESPYYNQRIRTFQRDEIYRYGVVLVDDKGRHSPVKWIADIRIPNNSMVISTYAGFNRLSTTTTYSHPIQVDFEFTNLPSGVVAVKVVYVKRTDKDRTVKLQGMASYIHMPYGFAFDTVSTLGNSTIAGFNSAAPNHIAIFSPEISFYKNFSQGVNDYVEVIGTYSGTVHTATYGKTAFHRMKATAFATAGTGRFAHVITSRIQNVTDTPDEEINAENFGLKSNFKPLAAWNSTNNYIGNLGTCLLTQLSSVLPVSGLTTSSYLLVNYRSNLFGSQYGGHTYEDRTRNEYIPASSRVDVSAGSATVHAIYGDTYINYTDHLVSFYNDYYSTVNGSTYSLGQNVMFPVETTVNLAYRLDDCWHRIHTTYPASLLIREKGNAEFTVGTTTYSPGWSDLYLENTVYKRLSDARKYYPAPIDYNPEFKNDALVMASNMKEGLETFDAWTQWATNEHITVDKKYGPVNKLVSWKNYLLYWQNDAVGVLSVLDRSVISDTQGRSTTLGQGEILQRYDNIATNIGLSTRFSITNSPNGVYWYDNKRRKINRFLNNIEDMTTIRGVNSYLNKITSDIGDYDNIISANNYYKGFFMSYNPMYNEIWFTVKQASDDGLALIFNEVVDSFTGFADTMAYYYMSFNNKVFSAYGKYIYKEDKGYPGLFFGKYYDSYVSVILNPIPNIVTTLTNLEISSEVYESVLDPEFEAINVPSLTTTAVTSVTGTGALSGGNITNEGGVPVFKRGVCYGPNVLPMIENDSHTSDGTGDGSYTSTVLGLIPATKYYLRAYAVNSVGAGYGSVRSFVTTIAAVISTTPVTNITETTVDTGWNLIQDGGEEPIESGLCWSTSTGPTTANDKESQQCIKGVYTYTITGLTDSTNYYIRAYAINSKGTVYGNEIAFNTKFIYSPTVTTKAISGLLYNGATSGGVIVSNGDAEITAKGVCFNKTGTPTTADTVVSAGTGDSSFDCVMEDLDDDTTYYVRAFATNSKGTSYGNQLSFKTYDLTTATITTALISSITKESAISGGNVTHDGYAAVTEKGICYHTSANPTTANTKVVSSLTGVGSFVSSITGLTQGTTYHVRAYAINGHGTSYGENYSFTTSAYAVPSVITVSSGSITTSGAILTGNATAENGSNIYEKGFYFGTEMTVTSNPKYATTSIGLGVFTKTMSGLDDDTVYYFCAYAMNASGETVGLRMTFTTLNALPGTVSTASVTSVSYTTAVCGGTVTDDGGDPITARGVCYNKTGTPTISDPKTTDGSGLGTFVSNMSGLDATSDYYVRAYVTNGSGTSYGEQKQFTTLTLAAPTLSLYPVGALTYTTADVSAILLSENGSAVTAYGFCWDEAPNPDLGDDYNVCTTSFSYQIPSLTYNTLYYVRAYATNAIGTTYSNQISFTIPNATYAALTMVSAAHLSQTTARLNSNISSAGTFAVTGRGFLYGDSIATMTTDVPSGSGIGTFQEDISGLTASTTYYVRAYADTYVGRAYSSNYLSFTTSAASVVPTIVLTSISDIAYTTCIIYLNVTSDGGAPVVGRGICLSTSPNPTTPYQSSGSGTGSFGMVVTGLTAGTTYYVRGFADNSAGRAYSAEHSFTTASTPVVTTVTDIDGNVYNTVEIGTQIWTIQPLRASKYSDGTTIPQASSYEMARNDSTGLYFAESTSYGKYYSGNAITNPRGIAYLASGGVRDTSWRVPTAADWNTLFTYLGTTTIAGGKLKQVGTTLWSSPNTGATNESGFTAVPGGGVYVGYDNYYYVTQRAMYWIAGGQNVALMHYNQAIADTELVDNVNCYPLRLVKNK